MNYLHTKVHCYLHKFYLYMHLNEFLMNIADLRWKFKQHDELISNGLHHSLFGDLLSKEKRKHSNNIWNELPRIVAHTKGCEFSKSTPSNSLNEIFVEKIYEVPGFIPLNGQTVYDVGASYGDGAIWWSKVHKAKVISFEPLPDIYKILKENISLNHVKVDANNFALGNGSKVHSTRNGNMMGRSTDIKSDTIMTTKLDDLDVKNMDLLKIDVEGFESDVIAGATKTIKMYKPNIIVETHSFKLKRECHNMLTNLGYVLSFEGRKVKPRDGWMDSIQNLFYSYSL